MGTRGFGLCATASEAPPGRTPGRRHERRRHELALDRASVLGPQGAVNGGKPKDTPIELQAPRNGRPRGRPALADDPELVERITSMRAHGMTLQGIADQLNEEGVPTVRGGVEWRPSSVRGGLGYKRRRELVCSLAAPDESGKEA